MPGDWFGGPCCSSFRSRRLWGLVYAVLLPGIGRSAAGDASPLFGVALFVLAAAGWCVFTLHDSLLVALSRPWWTVWRNGVFAISRIGLLVALGVLGFGAQGIVLSWVGSIVLWIAAGSVVLAVLLRRTAVRSAEGSLPSRLAAAARRRLLVVFLPLLALGALVAAPALELVFGAAYAEAPTCCDYSWWVWRFALSCSTSVEFGRLLAGRWPMPVYS
jgi:hypothetical protein